jgi:endonuclease/exonuclease/phosphatase family metal-dependent hydrolase
MLTKLVLAMLCTLMVGTALHFDPQRQRSLLATRTSVGPQLRLMTWNIGYAELEHDSRAHNEDLKAVAETILTTDPDAVALQELIGEEQLKILVGYLHGRYSGSVARSGNADRVEAILVKDRQVQLENVSAGEGYVLAANFRLRSGLPDIVLISAHADAFIAAKRRVFTGTVVDWARTRSRKAIVFIAGDFNLEVDSKDQSHLYTDDLKNDSETYSYLLKYFRDMGRDAGDTAANDRRIDYIFGPQENVLVRRAQVLRNAAVGHMDHWPLLIEVTL